MIGVYAVKNEYNSFDTYLYCGEKMQLNPDLSEFAKKGEAPRPIKTNKWHKAEEALWHIKSLKLNKEELNWLVNELINKKSI